jgi:hypothetical protein
MVSLTETNAPPRFSDLAMGGGTPRKAVLTALVVGTVLTMINHGDLILVGDWPPVWKIALTYCVPYCVTTWGAITGKRAVMRTRRV